eukprot:597273-Alexandrium_andersonii.AAC.1
MCIRDSLRSISTCREQGKRRRAGCHPCFHGQRQDLEGQVGRVVDDVAERGLPPCFPCPAHGHGSPLP